MRNIAVLTQFLDKTVFLKTGKYLETEIRDCIFRCLRCELFATYRINVNQRAHLQKNGASDNSGSGLILLLLMLHVFTMVIDSIIDEKQRLK
jgi:hypothetical protein